MEIDENPANHFRRINTHSTTPPPKSRNKMVGELLPRPLVRSINLQVNSPYPIVNNGSTQEFRIVKITPIRIKNISHFVAKRN